MKIIGKRAERANRLLVPTGTDGGDMDRGADIDRRRGRIDGGEIPRFATPLLLAHSDALPDENQAGAGPRRKINFLIGIARKRHHSQVRNSPWTRFFYGVGS